ncbi:alpha/beta hydrolase fold domain-containing protein [Desulfovibrio subterraneus]|uniref:Alpha/beta hydrolase fold-3 domain-containing protein n=1 Tax=Desulfovibrio subterraneus TaxID=2718620 RepID=A0A7J0BGQ1_9BACT|nr:alpha/beta hydrolase fold domain-containing protein [Desulfovibrio subterraneus]GFM32314.1 hypothetical protein DSM101010T_06790 [Desulfovibrio subterraneus]
MTAKVPATFFHYLLTLFLLAGSHAFAASSGTAGQSTGAYPFANRYEATVFGTPPEFRFQLKQRVTPVTPSVRSISIENRQVPEIFWYCKSVEYAEMLQKDEAPLIFIIAGTGGRFSSSKVEFLQRLFYDAGYHTVALSSPTHFNYIASLSKHGVAGYVPYDTEDLYTLMQWVKEDVESRRKVSRYSVTGYSLGAMHSAFLAERDRHEKRFNFDKVLLINPPVDLFSSATTFDSWLEAQNGNQTPQKAIDKFIRQFSEFYKSNNFAQLDSEVLYRFFTTVDMTDTELKQLIGASFRLTSSSMIFTSDVCLNAGYVVPANTHLDTASPLMRYFDTASQITFQDYFREFLLPYLQYTDSGMTEEKALADCSLRKIADFLRTSDNIRLVGNEDDPILQTDEVAFLKQTFGKRATLFATGGHCGNMQYVDFAQAMLRAMERQE